MVSESRTHKSIHNSVVALIFYIIGLLLSFVSRKIFLEYLGTEILGLNTTAQNLLQFLNLAELGIGSAVGFSLYKPIRDEDTQSINEIVALQGKLYARIGLLIIVASGILMAFFPLIFKKMELPMWYAFASFGVLLFSSLLGYFVNYKQIVLTSSQKNYKIQYSYTSLTLLKIVFQMMAVAEFSNGYVWWLVFEVVFAIISSWSLHRMTLKEFPELLNFKGKYKELKEKYSHIVVKIKQIFYHKIAGFALTQSSPLIIYGIIDLSVVAIYGNYILITTGIQKIVFAMFNGIDAGVGNLVAEGDLMKIKKVFLELFSIRFVIASMLAMATLCLGQPFIALWIGSEYILPFSTLLLITINLFIQISRYTIDTFLNAYGLYSDIWAPVVETALNIGLSILLGIFYGLNGIIAGVIISQVVIVLLWKPYYLITRELKDFLKEYIAVYLLHLVVAVGIGFLFWYFLDNIIALCYNSFLNLIVIGSGSIVTYVIVLIGVLYLVSPGMRWGITRMISIFKRKTGF